MKCQGQVDAFLPDRLGIFGSERKIFAAQSQIHRFVQFVTNATHNLPRANGFVGAAISGNLIIVCASA